MCHGHTEREIEIEKVEKESERERERQWKSEREWKIERKIRLKRKDRIVSTVPVFIGSAPYTFCILHLLQYFDLCIKDIARKILLFIFKPIWMFLESVFKSYNLHSVTPLFCSSLSLYLSLSVRLPPSSSHGHSITLSLYSHSYKWFLSLSHSLSLSHLFGLRGMDINPEHPYDIRHHVHWESRHVST